MANRKLIVVIDGPAGAGKSSASRRLARRIDGTYLDTGAMFRALTLEALRRKIDLADPAARARVADEARVEVRVEPRAPGASAEDKLRVLLDCEDVTDAIRTREVTEAIHFLAGDGHVREVLVVLQREFARNAPRSVVAEGRDLASVVFPDADVKIYLDASVAERARRRARDLGAQAPPLPVLEQEIATRDHRDSTRAVAPLVRVPEAVHLDTSDLTQDQVVERLAAIVTAAG